MRSASGAVRPNSRGMSCCSGCASWTVCAVVFPVLVGEMLMSGRDLRSAPPGQGYRTARPATRCRIETHARAVRVARSSGAEVLEEAERPVFTGVVVRHALPLQREALRADER